MPGFFGNKIDEIKGRLPDALKQIKIAREMFKDPRDIIERRGLDKDRFNRFQNNIFATGSGIGTGFFNQGERQLQQGGFGRSGRRFTLPGAAASARSKFVTDATGRLMDFDQNVADRNFGIDAQQLEIMRQRIRADIAAKKAGKFNPVNFALDAAKTYAAFQTGGASVGAEQALRRA